MFLGRIFIERIPLKRAFFLYFIFGNIFGLLLSIGFSRLCWKIVGGTNYYQIGHVVKWLSIGLFSTYFIVSGFILWKSLGALPRKYPRIIARTTLALTPLFIFVHIVLSLNGYLAAYYIIN